MSNVRGSKKAIKRSEANGSKHRRVETIQKLRRTPLTIEEEIDALKEALGVQDEEV